ncbi:MAG: class I SAM-dependent methyltransferase [Hoeflea sp.]|uniref:class I SAM-dependent methyltransferase n=1 Tax=Hoeflea sp. TaxID=1940281 RepID=UPI001D5B4643|nr:class I SAM-dependent methyltransferase [Hoeflea sp.]MBU4530506.1 class I SAM-dependent methyltransferase [Alphaproteobacteria bacterium]MBU4545293.1 class I SAM-dependent methyltransferase [Alphaproteobacteria bacterium]MBU4548942.1 class I SAM-dependent methyltransferase [Alphaproteobacteria bacterium]MBV1722097.1 class I SAM-dependent methyltransferase [Hoeflea sp.]MBV1761447.1 class I SAM-dependent methyltransferase [Hoeflea sp.]
MSTNQHWDTAYTARDAKALTWFEETPEASIRLVRQMMPAGGALVDIGGGSSALVDHCLDAGIGPVTVLDLSAEALAITQARLGDRADEVSLVVGDVRDWQPDRLYDLWHDRAAFHFLTDIKDRRSYLRTLDAALRPGGVAIILTFASTGPATCSGLPVQRYAPSELNEMFANLAPGLLVPLHSELLAHRTPKGAVQDFQISVFQKKETTP